MLPADYSTRCVRDCRWTLIVVGALLACTCWVFPEHLVAQPPPNEAEGSAETAEAPDWAADYLASPLANMESPSLEALQGALADPQLSRTVVRDHFPRAVQLTPEEQKTFLTEALDHDLLEVRQQAAEQLQRLSLLQQVIAERLRGMVADEDLNQQEAGMVGLVQLDPEAVPRDADYVRSLVQLLGSERPAIRSAAASQLQSLGPVAVPILLDALSNSAEADLAIAAAEVLGRIAGPPQVPKVATAPRDEQALQPPAKAFAPRSLLSSEGPEALKPRVVDEKEPEITRVYYGTNRAITPPPTIDWIWTSIHAGIAALVVFGTVGFVWFSFATPRSPSRSEHTHRWKILFLCLLGLVAIFWSAPYLNSTLRTALSHRHQFAFGPRRSSDSTIYYGWCDVSIPPSHRPGQVETPLIGPENEQKHVVLKSINRIEEDHYFHELRKALAAARDPNACFVFIHGYNVNFNDAAKRTAQIYYDLKFEGVPIFYSWPSRGSLRHYFSDRNEVQFSRELIKNFLVSVVQRSGAERVHIIAHSMGADAVGQAVATIEGGEKIFDQIILAAPDIDAEVFLQQIVPRLQQHGRRTTLYCSRNDFALHAAYHFNDSWRAGDSSRGVVIAAGLDTIDASSIDTELLGHSYYGNCQPVLDDVAKLFLENQSPEERNLVILPTPGDMFAWTFPELAKPAAGESVQETTPPPESSVP